MAQNSYIMIIYGNYRTNTETFPYWTHKETPVLAAQSTGEPEVKGSMAGRSTPNSFKMVLAAPRLALRLAG